MSSGFRLSLAVTLAVTSMLCRPVDAQAGQTALQYRFSPTPAGAPEAKRLALKTSYHVRIASAWPQMRTTDGACLNGGDEVLEGTLTRSADGRYAGTLTRTTGVLFCGVHATAMDACQLALSGRGEVQAVGQLYRGSDDSDGLQIALVWRPDAARSQVSVEGSCIKTFEDGLEAMYLTAQHRIEFTLPWAGTGREVERLEDYGWIVEVE